MRYFLILFLNLNLTSSTLIFADMPSSQRLEKVINKTTPLLKKSLKAKGFRLGAPLYLRIFKEEAILEVWLKQKKQFKLFKTYPICTFSGKLGPKQKEGDYQAPEGFYFVKAQQLNPYSRFHLSFNLGYPNQYDRAHHRTGSALMVHGNCVSMGCYAMTDKKIEEIYLLAHYALQYGQSYFRVHIFPFKMTVKNLQKHKKSPWADFWFNLKTGYDWFEQHQYNPPNIEVKNQRYIFN